VILEDEGRQNIVTRSYMKNSSVDRERESHDLVVAVAGSFRIDISIWKRVKEKLARNLIIILSQINILERSKIQINSPIFINNHEKI